VDELTALVDLARAAAIEAGELLLRRRRDSAESPGASGDRPTARDLGVATKSTPTDLVTEVDRAAERLVVGRLLDARPGDGLVGEEGAAVDGSTGVRWLVDPIDGTTNFVYDLPGFAVSIAAEIDGRPAVGVVADPRHGEVYEAVRGRGALRNGEPVRPSGRGDLATALLATGFSYEPERRRRQAAVLVEVLPRVRDIRRLGAASVDLCAVACGRVDGYYEKGLSPWDHAAGALIAAEAGATVTDLDGAAASGRFCLAATPALHAELVFLLDRAGARDA
jgi:myo-inositol-1(or 4)-monophosphatase